MAHDKLLKISIDCSSHPLNTWGVCGVYVCVNVYASRNSSNLPARLIDFSPSKVTICDFIKGSKMDILGNFAPTQKAVYQEYQQKLVMQLCKQYYHIQILSN